MAKYIEIIGGRQGVKPRFPHTNSSTGLYTFSYKDKLREFDKRSKHFLLGDNFINSHNFISWLGMDIISKDKIDVGHQCSTLTLAHLPGASRIMCWASV